MTNPRCRRRWWTSLSTTLFFASRKFAVYFFLPQFDVLSALMSLPPPWILLLHSREEGVKKFTGKTDPVEVLIALRREKDKFKKPKERLPPHAMLALEWGLFRPWGPASQPPLGGRGTRRTADFTVGQSSHTVVHHLRAGRLIFYFDSCCLHTGCWRNNQVSLRWF